MSYILSIVRNIDVGGIDISEKKTNVNLRKIPILRFAEIEKKRKYLKNKHEKKQNYLMPENI